MTARETKPELAGLNLQGDFKLAHSDALVDLLDASAAQQPAEMIDIFNLNARGAQDKAQLFVTAHTGERTSLSGIAAGSNSTLADKEKREKDEKRRLEDTLYRMLLDQLADAQRQMAEAAEVLRGKYGDDIVGGMAAAFLSDDQLATLQTDEDRLAALAKIFLDDNGNIKPEYADSPEAQYVQGWNNTQKIEAKIDQIPNMSVAELTDMNSSSLYAVGLKIEDSVAATKAEMAADINADAIESQLPTDVTGLFFPK